jgi:hypothetical protein
VDQFDYTGDAQNAYTAMFSGQFSEHGFQAAPAPDIWIDPMIPQHLANLINVACFKASPAYIIDFIGTGFAVCLGLLKAIGQEGYPEIGVQKPFFMYPVYQFKFDHIQIILFPVVKQLFIA